MNEEAPASREQPQWGAGFIPQEREQGTDAPARFQSLLRQPTPLRTEVRAPLRSQHPTLDAWIEKEGRIDTSPFILSPIEAERKSALLNRRNAHSYLLDYRSRITRMD